MPLTNEERLAILRDLSPLNDLIQAVEGGAAALPRVARGDIGAMWTLELGRLLAANLARVDAVSIDAAPAAANTTASTSFSFPTMPDGTPAARHRILSAMCSVPAADVANFVGASLSARPFNDPIFVAIGHAVAAQLVIPVSTSSRSPLTGIDQGLWGLADQDYRWAVRSGAGGASSASLELLVMLVPAGMEVPR